MLKWLTKKTYATLSEVLGAVHKELEELQPVDTDSIKWTKGKEGMRAELNRELLGGGGLAEEQEAEEMAVPDYMSSFKLVLGSRERDGEDGLEECIWVVQGADEEQEEAGKVVLPNYNYGTTLSIPKTSLPLDEGDIYLNLIVKIDGSVEYTIGEQMAYAGHVLPIRLGGYTARRGILQYHVTGDIEATALPRWPRTRFLAFIDDATPKEEEEEESGGGTGVSLWICDGHSLLSSVAGSVRLQGRHYLNSMNVYATLWSQLIPKTELPLKDGTVCLVVSFDPYGNSEYGFYYEGDEDFPEGSHVYSTQIAQYFSGSGKLVQIYEGGDIIIDLPGYWGAFKVVQSGENVTVLNGLDFNSEVAGTIGPSPINIAFPKTTIQASGEVGILVSYEDGEYTAEFIEMPASVGVKQAFVHLATVLENYVAQHHTSNINFSERWL